MAFDVRELGTAMLRNSDHIKTLFDRIDRNREDIIVLKTKFASWGFMAGILGGAGVSVITKLLVH